MTNQEFETLIKIKGRQVDIFETKHGKFMACMWIDSVGGRTLWSNRPCTTRGRALQSLIANYLLDLKHANH